jgi:AraC-like DNA-binding protein
MSGAQRSIGTMMLSREQNNWHCHPRHAGVQVGQSASVSVCAASVVRAVRLRTSPACSRRTCAASRHATELFENHLCSGWRVRLAGKSAPNGVRLESVIRDSVVSERSERNYAATHREIPAFLFAPLWTELERRGVSLTELERLSGISRPVVGRFTDILTVQQALDFYDASIELTGDDTLGLALSRDLSISSLHLFGQVMLACPTLQRALELIASLEPRLLEHGVCREPLESSRLRLGQYSAVLSTPAEQLHAQFTAAFFAKFVCFFCPAVARDVVAYFPFAAPRNAAAYEAHFPAGVCFDADGTFIVFPRYALDHARADADPRLAEQMRIFAGDLYATEGNAEDWIARTSQVLRAEPAPRTLSKALLAKRLGLSSQGLVRRLAEEGTTISALVDQVLYARSLRLLTSSRANYEEIAEALGYAEVTSFIRAFRRWSGTTPHAYRQNKGGECRD